MPSKIKRSQIQLVDLVSSALATDASGNIIASPGGAGDMLKSENLSGLANNATARSNIGLGNVDNTSDNDKPVSTAQATAIGLKANTASPTFTGTVILPAGQVVNGVTLSTGAGTGNFLRGDGTYAAPGGGGSTFWTNTPGSPVRTSDTTFTVTDTANTNKYDLLLQRGTQVKWLESTVEKRAMIVSATYATNTVTVTIVGDTMTSIDSNSLKYHNLPAKTIKFQYPLTTAVATDIAAPFQSDKAYRVYGAKAYLATAGITGSSTYDIHKGGTTMFTNKLTLATGVTASADFTANNGTSLASGDIVTIDIDAISTTAGVGLTVDLYLGESQLSQQA